MYTASNGNSCERVVGTHFCFVERALRELVGQRRKVTSTSRSRRQRRRRDSCSTGGAGGVGDDFIHIETHLRLRVRASSEARACDCGGALDEEGVSECEVAWLQHEKHERTRGLLILDHSPKARSAHCFFFL